ASAAANIQLLVQLLVELALLGVELRHPLLLDLVRCGCRCESLVMRLQVTDRSVAIDGIAWRPHVGRAAEYKQTAEGCGNEKSCAHDLLPLLLDTPNIGRVMRESTKQNFIRLNTNSFCRWAMRKRSSVMRQTTLNNFYNRTRRCRFLPPW